MTKEEVGLDHVNKAGILGAVRYLSMANLVSIRPDSMAKNAHNAAFQYRLETSRFRSLPHFLIIGAQKSGTSSLFHYLCQHPQIVGSYRKEVHFFDSGTNPRVDVYEKGPLWYRAYFPLTDELGDRSITGEATPRYLYHPLAPGRIASLIPHVKLIAILRNPTERAISSYFHQKRKHREPLTIMEALAAESKRLEAAIQNKDYSNYCFNRFSYQKRGLYKEQLERYFKYFSTKQILILNSVDFFTKTSCILSQIFKFLDVDIDVKIKDLTPRNISIRKPNISQHVCDYLDNYFAEHNHALYDLLNKDFGW